MTSLPSTFLSVLLHGAAVVATLMAFPAEQPETRVSQMLYIPVELVTIGDSTNLTEIVQAEEIAEEEIEAASEASAAPAPAPPEVEEDTVSFDKPKEQPKEEPKKTEAKPSPAPAKTFNSELDDILASVTKDPPKQQRNNANPTPATKEPQAPRLSVGDRRRMTATVEAVITSQLIEKGCWADHSDMADAKRLKATFRVWFGRNGKFSQTPQLQEPTRKPANDPPLNTYIVHAERALNMCNNLGWQVPEEYFQLPQPQYIDIEFLPKIGAAQ